MKRRGRRLLALGAAITLAVAMTACTGDAAEPPPQTVTRPAKPDKLTFGVFGNQDEVGAYQQVADSYNAVTDESDVSLAPYATEDELMAAVDAGEVPDVFLVSRRDLAALTDDGLNRPLSDLLEERGVDFGDTYSRDALEAFSSERELQCMPYGIAPDVVYYNTDLVDFDAMAERGLLVPDTLVEPAIPRWSLEMFQAAAEFATKPRRKISGLYVEPTLRGLAPFIYSAGGELYDDDEAPTSLAFSEGDTRDALTATLPLLRDARLSLSDEQLARATPQEWFERGRLAMLVGTRSLVPELRAVEGLDFDVMPIPVVDDDATVGDITGICVSAEADTVSESADFLVHAISGDSVRQVVAAGYLSPANQTVALSEDFLDPTELPEHSSVFVASVRAMRIPPLLRDRDELLAATEADVRSLITLPILEPADIEAITTAIDEESRTVLDPEAVPSESAEE
ncbi:MAG: extracellular solute-binding protein [Nocardioides sp.]|nr:extracellular solute-binding protein [Nocardioides sp.]